MPRHVGYLPGPMQRVNDLFSVTELVGVREEPFVVMDRGPVRFIVLNRPSSRNALTRQMRGELPLHLAAADAEPGVAAVILTGAGTAFCAGVDLKERAATGPTPPIKPNPAEALRSVRKPVIAAVNGACTTGALEMALSCSFIIASVTARFADTHAKLGLFPRWGQPSLLTRSIGIRRARQLLLTGELIDAQTALRWGMVNELAAPEELLLRCLEMGTSIAAADSQCIRLLQETLQESTVAEHDPLVEAERSALACFDESRRTPR
jgi:enoyl-CoA hydratase